MPLLPPEGDLSLDPRLEPFRDRAALLHRGDAQVGQLFVETAWQVEQTGGRFLWRRWSEPIEAVRLYVRVGGTASDSTATCEGFGELLAQWAAGEFEVNGELLRLEWLPDAESRSAEEQMLWAGLPLERRLERVRRLWRMHKAEPYPPRFRADQVQGIDLVQLDADLADAVIAWIGSGGRLDADQRADLRRLVADADLVMPALAADERVRFRRLQRMAAPALNA